MWAIIQSFANDFFRSMSVEEILFADLPANFFVGAKRPIGSLTIPKDSLELYQGFLKIGLIERYPDISGNRIIHMGDPRSRLIIQMGCANIVELGTSSMFNASLTMWTESRFSVGAGVRCNGMQSECRFSQVRIGDNCLLSDGIWVQASDMHAIWDIESGGLVNGQGFSVDIGDFVWLGRNSSVVRPAKIGKGSIIGFGSVVTKDVLSFSVAAGNPARVIRRQCTWTGLFDDAEFRRRMDLIDSGRQ